jgi:FeS assembly SUF system regulator
MLKIGRLTDYGTLIMTHMARDSGRLFAAQEIALAVGVAQPTATKLLKMLARSGLLESRRGIHGGYNLARAPAEISMGEVISALEGPMGLTDCGTASTPRECNRGDSCSARANWQRISQAVSDALDSVSLAEMAQPSQTVQVHRRPISSQGLHS